MTASVRLPVAPRPFADELFSSWMTRVSARYGSEPLELTVYLAGQGGPTEGLRQVDDVAPDMGLLRLWAKACRIDPERLCHRSLAFRYPDRRRGWFLTETVLPVATPICGGVGDWQSRWFASRIERCSWTAALPVSAACGFPFAC